VEFVANVSHELQTPLTSIKGYTETLKQGALQDPQVAEKFLRRIGENADRLKALISDILTLSYIETFPKDVDWETFSSQKLKEKLESMFEPLIKEKRQVLKVEFNSTNLEGDFSKLLQVFTNLVDNAVKYSPEGTQILVTENFYDNKFHFLVEDTGKGIPSVHLPRLFERFYRVDAARSRDTGGTGLGLSIAKHVVLAHGGSISVESTPGGGTTFTVRLPRRSESSEVKNFL
jgi:two-component system phosphate regulon sensor histidine kinase PhoR